MAVKSVAESQPILGAQSAGLRQASAPNPYGRRPALAYSAAILPVTHRSDWSELLASAARDEIPAGRGAAVEVEIEAETGV